MNFDLETQGSSRHDVFFINESHSVNYVDPLSDVKESTFEGEK